MIYTHHIASVRVNIAGDPRPFVIQAPADEAIRFALMQYEPSRHRVKFSDPKYGNTVYGPSSVDLIAKLFGIDEHGLLCHKTWNKQAP